MRCARRPPRAAHRAHAGARRVTIDGPQIRPAQGAAVAFAVALALRLALAPRMAVLQADGCTYVWLAQDALAGRISEALRHPFHPLYPAMIAALGRLGLPLETAGVALSAGLGARAAPLFFLAFARALGCAAGLAGALLYAASPYAVRAGADVMSEASFIFFIAASLAAGARAMAPPGDPCGVRLPGALVSGLCAGLAFLVRPEGLVAAIAMALFLAPRAALGPARGRAMGAFCLVIAGTMMTAAPYVAWISADAGELRLTRKKSIASMIDSATGLEILAPPRSPADASPAPRPDDLRWLIAPPVPPPPASVSGRLDATAEVFSRFIDTVHPLMVALALVPIIALIRAWRSPGDRGVARFIALLALGLFLAALLNRLGVGYAHKRHLLAAACLVAAPAGLGATMLAGALSARGLHPRAASAIVVVLCAAILLSKALAPQFAERTGLLDASRALAARDPASFATSRPLVLGYAATEIAYYAGGREADLPYGSAAAVLASARAQGIRYVAIALRGGDGAPSDAPIRALADAGVRPFFDRSETIEGHIVRRVLYDLAPEGAR
jgi:hypothetical protein